MNRDVEKQDLEAVIAEPRCQSCAHFAGWGIRRCLAFPDGIPDDIYLHGLPHDRPYPGDHGIRYEKSRKRSD